MTTRLSHPWYNLVDAIHACYNLVFSVWVTAHAQIHGVLRNRQKPYYGTHLLAINDTYSSTCPPAIHLCIV